MDLIHHIETLLGRKAEMRMLPMQAGDVVETFADIESSQRDLGFKPVTSIVDGLGRFVAWYKDYHGIH
jgi:UDP-glucuronate 4-epimerase